MAKRSGKVAESNGKAYPSRILVRRRQSSSGLKLEKHTPEVKRWSIPYEIDRETGKTRPKKYRGWEVLVSDGEDEEGGVEQADSSDARSPAPEVALSDPEPVAEKSFGNVETIDGKESARVESGDHACDGEDILPVTSGMNDSLLDAANSQSREQVVNIAPRDPEPVTEGPSGGKDVMPSRQEVEILLMDGGASDGEDILPPSSEVNKRLLEIADSQPPQLEPGLMLRHLKPEAEGSSKSKDEMLTAQKADGVLESEHADDDEDVLPEAGDMNDSLLECTNSQRHRRGRPLKQLEPEKTTSGEQRTPSPRHGLRRLQINTQPEEENLEQPSTLPQRRPRESFSLHPPTEEGVWRRRIAPSKPPIDALECVLIPSPQASRKRTVSQSSIRSSGRTSKAPKLLLRSSPGNGLSAVADGQNALDYTRNGSSDAQLSLLPSHESNIGESLALETLEGMASQVAVEGAKADARFICYKLDGCKPVFFTLSTGERSCYVALIQHFEEQMRYDIDMGEKGSEITQEIAAFLRKFSPLIRDAFAEGLCTHIAMLRDEIDSSAREKHELKTQLADTESTFDAQMELLGERMVKSQDEYHMEVNRLKSVVDASAQKNRNLGNELAISEFSKAKETLLNQCLVEDKEALASKVRGRQDEIERLVQYNNHEFQKWTAEREGLSSRLQGSMLKVKDLHNYMSKKKRAHGDERRSLEQTIADMEAELVKRKKLQIDERGAFEFKVADLESKLSTRNKAEGQDRMMQLQELKTGMTNERREWEKEKKTLMEREKGAEMCLSVLYTDIEKLKIEMETSNLDHKAAEAAGADVNKLLEEEIGALKQRIRVFVKEKEQLLQRSQESERLLTLSSTEKEQLLQKTTESEKQYRGTYSKMDDLNQRFRELSQRYEDCQEALRNMRTANLDLTKPLSAAARQQRSDAADLDHLEASLEKKDNLLGKAKEANADDRKHLKSVQMLWDNRLREYSAQFEQLEHKLERTEQLLRDARGDVEAYADGWKAANRRRVEAEARGAAEIRKLQEQIRQLEHGN